MPGRQQPQHELAAVGVHGVAGVVSALVARHDRKIRRQQIDDLALAFVAPLRAEHRDVHKCSILPSTLAGTRVNPLPAPLATRATVFEPDDPPRRPSLTLDRAPRDRRRRRSRSRSRADARGRVRRRARRRRSHGRRRPTRSTASTPASARWPKRAIPRDALGALQLNLLRSHAAGVGDPLPVRAVRASMALRANVLAKGFSGIRREHARAADRAAQPRASTRACRAAGSVGASGDLAPLAHLVAGARSAKARPTVGDGRRESLSGRGRARAPPG